MANINRTNGPALLSTAQNTLGAMSKHANMNLEDNFLADTPDHTIPSKVGASANERAVAEKLGNRFKELYEESISKNRQQPISYLRRATWAILQTMADLVGPYHGLHSNVWFSESPYTFEEKSFLTLGYESAKLVHVLGCTGEHGIHTECIVRMCDEMSISILMDFKKARNDWRNVMSSISSLWAKAIVLALTESELMNVTSISYWDGELRKGVKYRLSATIKGKIPKNYLKVPRQKADERQHRGFHYHSNAQTTKMTFDLSDVAATLDHILLDEVDASTKERADTENLVFPHEEIRQEPSRTGFSDNIRGKNCSTLRSIAEFILEAMLKLANLNTVYCFRQWKIDEHTAKEVSYLTKGFQNDKQRDFDDINDKFEAHSECMANAPNKLAIKIGMKFSKPREECRKIMSCIESHWINNAVVPSFNLRKHVRVTDSHYSGKIGGNGVDCEVTAKIDCEVISRPIEIVNQR